MKRNVLVHALIYGLIGGVLIALLKWTEYRFLVIEHSIEIYGGLIAATFAVLGIWLGLKLTGTRERIVVKEVPFRLRRLAEPETSHFQSRTIRPGREKARGSGHHAPRTRDPGADRAGNEQSRNRGKALCEREHGQDPFQPRIRQIGR